MSVARYPESTWTRILDLWPTFVCLYLAAFCPWVDRSRVMALFVLRATIMAPLLAPLALVLSVRMRMGAWTVPERLDEARLTWIDAAEFYRWLVGGPHLRFLANVASAGVLVLWSTYWTRRAEWDPVEWKHAENPWEGVLVLGLVVLLLSWGLGEIGLRSRAAGHASAARGRFRIRLMLAPLLVPPALLLGASPNLVWAAPSILVSLIPIAIALPLCALLKRARRLREFGRVE